MSYPITAFDRSTLIRVAASLPVGDPGRRGILAALTTFKTAGGEYNGDPNVSLESVVYEAQKQFVEDVARAVLRYSTLRTPLQGKGNVFMRGGTAHAGVVNRAGETEAGLGVEVKVAGGKILVTLSDLEDQNAKTYRFQTHDTPASIGATLSGHGREYLGSL